MNQRRICVKAVSYAAYAMLNMIIGCRICVRGAVANATSIAYATSIVLIGCSMSDLDDSRESPVHSPLGIA